MECQDDSCELVHCENCGCHTIGNDLMAGLCDLCYDLQEEENRKHFLNQQSP